MTVFNSGQAYLQSLRAQYCPEPVVSKAETLPHYYHTLDTILERVNHYKETCDNQNLYVYFMRYAQLGTKIVTHPEWHKPKNKADRDRVNGVVDIVMDELGVLQTVLIQAYNKELRRHYQLQLAQEEKEEELMARIESVYVHVDRKQLSFSAEGKVFCMYHGNWKQMHGSGLIELFSDSAAQRLQIVIHQTSTFWLIPPLQTKGPRGLILTLSALFDEKGEDNFILAVKFHSENDQRSFSLIVENSLTVDQVFRKPKMAGEEQHLTSTRIPSLQPRQSYSSNRRSSYGASSQSSFDLPFHIGGNSNHGVDQPRASFESTSSVMSARFGAAGYSVQSPQSLREPSPTLPRHRARRDSRTPSVRHVIDTPTPPSSKRTRKHTSKQFDEYLREATRSNINLAEKEIEASRRRRDLRLSDMTSRIVDDLQYSYDPAHASSP